MWDTSVEDVSLYPNEQVPFIMLKGRTIVRQELKESLDLNKKLEKQNQDLLIELSKAKNARSYYNNLEKQFREIQKQNEELSHQLSLKKVLL